MDARARRFREAARRENRGQIRRGVRYSRELRRAAVEYAGRREAQGARRAAIALELGVSPLTLMRWLRDEGRPGFRKVTLREARVESSARTAVLTTPAGFRVEGLDVADLAALLRALS